MVPGEMMKQQRLSRRDAIRTLAAGGIGVASVPLWVDALSALAREQAPHAHAAMPPAAPAPSTWTPKVLSAHQDQTVTTLCELIIPQTETPGAKAARVNRFIDAVLKEAPAADRASFLKGLAWMDTRSKALFGEDVTSATPDQQTALLTRLSSEESGAAEDQAGRDFFRALKSMTITGYYSTEIGLRKELGDDGQLVLAEFKGCTHPEHQIRD
jgi:hypothetical protein